MSRAGVIGSLRRLGIGPGVGAVLVGAFLLCAILGPLVAPASPTAQDLDHLLEGPSHAHLLGTDENGCDVLSQLLYGSRLAALISTTVVGVSLVIGITVGVIAGYFGGALDEAIMRMVDILLAFPGLLLNLAIVIYLITRVVQRRRSHSGNNRGRRGSCVLGSLQR